MKTFKFEKLVSSIFLFTFLGCASLPPEAVISQKKVSEGIETARSNQVLLINSYAEEAKSKLQLSFQMAIPDSLKKEYGDKESYTQEEMTDSLVDYGKQLQDALKKVDDKRNDLIQDTNDFFNELAMLSNVNLELLESVVKLNEKYKAISDGVVSENENFKEILGRE